MSNQIPTFNLPNSMSNFGYTPQSTPDTGYIDPLASMKEGMPGQTNYGYNPQNTPILNQGNIPSIPGTKDMDSPGFFSPEGGSRFLIPGMNALTGIGNYMLSKDMLELGQDQFNFSKNQSNRDFNSQAQVYNSNLQNSYKNNLKASGGYDTNTPEGQQAFDDALNAYVAENKISDVNL